ncbi:MAG: secretin N-terminal domain-containing protein [Pyramidobacter sp.]|nr:secretin N-terminal domain-containing protein [Pyramidobacter sp.]
MNVDGSCLTSPQIVSQTDKQLMLMFHGVAFPAQHHERGLHAPLAPYVSVEEVDQDTLVTLTCTAFLEMTDVKGVSTDRLRIKLVRKTASASSEKPSAGTRKRHNPFHSMRKITLTLSACPLPEVFRALAVYADVNVIIDTSVPTDKTLTISLQDVPLKQAFEFVLRSAGLECGIIGRTAVIASAHVLDVVMARPVTVVYPVSYAEPEKIVPILRETAGLTAPGNSVIIDDRLRELYIKAAPIQHERVRVALQKLDAAGKQVMLKARIIEVSDDASDELETALNAVYDWWWISYRDGVFSGGFAQSGHKPGTAEGPLPYTDTASLSKGIGNGMANLAGTATRMLDFRIEALVQENKAKVLADPTVTVLDGQKASVKLVEKLKYVTKRDDAGNPTYEDEEVGPKLEVLPRIGRNGVISVNLALSTGEIVQWVKGGQGEQIPQTNSREVLTSVRVRDGEPFVIGGLFKETHSKSKASIPVLSSIPLLGQLFQSRLDKTKRSQVVMILIPCVLDIPDTALRGSRLDL